MSGLERRKSAVQIELLSDQRTGCAGRVQLMSGERAAIEAGPLDGTFSNRSIRVQ
jgi:hypothetical protein